MSSRVKPSYHDSESEDDFLGNVLHQDESDNDDLLSLSFAALTSAQEKLKAEDRASRQGRTLDRAPAKAGRSKKSFEPPAKHNTRLDLDLDLDGLESDFFEDSLKPKSSSKSLKSTNKKNKHAPSEASSKRPVGKIREIPGLKLKKDSTLYQDVRFDAAYGKADWNRIRKDYAFLDEYREKEVAEMQRKLQDKKLLKLMSQYEIDNLKFEMQSLKSRLDTLRNRDLANNVIDQHKKEQKQKMRAGEQVNPYFLKRSEQRKLVQKAKFENMKTSQREKVMERKRKRKLGREFRELEFRGQQ